jgi:nucleoside-diphosphate kinase
METHLATECTLAIIKPDAVARGISADIVSRISAAGLKIKSIKSMQLTQSEAEGFYTVHRSRGFFADLTRFMSSGKIIVLVLEAENAIPLWRQTMGATDPAKADAGTIRRDFGTSIQNNCTHGSDAPDTAAFEIGYFFAGYELL